MCFVYFNFILFIFFIYLIYFLFLFFSLIFGYIFVCFPLLPLTDEILVEREKNKLLQEEMEATLHDIQNM